VLCCAVLCCAVLCCAVLCCAVLCCAVLCCAVLTKLVPAGEDQGLGQSMETLVLFNVCRQVHEPAGMGRGGYCRTS